LFCWQTCRQPWKHNPPADASRITSEHQSAAHRRVRLAGQRRMLHCGQPRRQTYVVAPVLEALQDVGVQHSHAPRKALHLLACGVNDSHLGPLVERSMRPEANSKTDATLEGHAQRISGWPGALRGTAGQRQGRSCSSAPGIWSRRNMLRTSRWCRCSVTRKMVAGVHTSSSVPCRVRTEGGSGWELKFGEGCNERGHLHWFIRGWLAPRQRRCPSLFLLCLSKMTKIRADTIARHVLSQCSLCEFHPAQTRRRSSRRLRLQTHSCSLRSQAADDAATHACVLQ